MNATSFIVAPGTDFSLAKRPTRIDPFCKSKDDYRKLFRHHVKCLDAPWYVVPADHKKTARLIVSQLLLDTFASLDLHYPTASAERQQELVAIRGTLDI